MSTRRDAWWTSVGTYVENVRPVLDASPVVSIFMKRFQLLDGAHATGWDPWIGSL